MLRRNQRLRKEYLYRKSLEGKERAAYERKRVVRKALEEGKPIPNEVRGEERKLRHEVELEDDNTAVPRTHIDDEYAFAGEADPKVLITTSRDPSSRLTQFAKEMKLVIPNAQRINRGGMVLSELVETCRSHDFTDIVVLHEHRGEPDASTQKKSRSKNSVSVLQLHELRKSLWASQLASIGKEGPVPMTVLLHDCTCRWHGGTISEAYPHLIFDAFTSKINGVGTISEAYPHLIFDAFTSKLGERCANILKHIFPVPKDDTKRVITFANRSDFISFRHHTYLMPKGAKSVELTECGPRFELKLFQIKLGTMDQQHVENEWVLRSYTRAAKKQRLADPKADG
ncbi:Brix-domain-containing protein [Dunaliella salina]|uniref:Brix-domain-containing protein n=1 Tax=Dunaliella salina TaxID=3046 RepID=A0ABQ7H4M2_DUNSA|nr:Brix-domain-containing protein [Dunaliella salina]|eukprot:KAF5841802.1 Brix-domain-containing protein [Dunaliella salina]